MYFKTIVIKEFTVVASLLINVKQKEGGSGITLEGGRVVLSFPLIVASLHPFTYLPWKYCSHVGEPY